MRSRDWQIVLLASLLATAGIQTRADANSFFNSVGDTFKNAGQTIAQGTQAAYGTVKNETISAAQATGCSDFLSLISECWTVLLEGLPASIRLCLICSTTPHITPAGKLNHYFRVTLREAYGLCRGSLPAGRADNCRHSKGCLQQVRAICTSGMEWYTESHQHNRELPAGHFLNSANA